MFYQNRFTDRASNALRLAQEAAGRMGHSYVGSEHLLDGLLLEGGGLAAKVLTDLGVTSEAVEQQIEKLVGFGTPDPTAPQGLTPRTKRVVELAIATAAQLGHSYVGTEHLLAGLLREGQNVALSVLSALGVSAQQALRFLRLCFGALGLFHRLGRALLFFLRLVDIPQRGVFERQLACHLRSLLRLGRFFLPSARRDGHVVLFEILQIVFLLNQLDQLTEQSPRRLMQGGKDAHQQKE